MTVRIRIREHERGLWFRSGNFKRALGPGVYWFPSALARPRANSVQVFNTLDSKLEHPLLAFIAKNPSLRDQITPVELSSEDRALVWKNGRLVEFLGPGQYAYWKRPHEIVIETFRVSEPRFTHGRLEAILSVPESRYWFETVEVSQGQVALLFVNGRLIERLGEGKHVFWRNMGSVKCRIIELREQVLDVAGQEIMTNDKVTLRLNLIVSFVITDPERSVLAVSDASQALYREAQLVLRAAVGARRLDSLLSEKESVGAEVRESLASRAAEFGVQVRSVGLRDIVLPGEMKIILNRVIEAQKQAEADLIKRREETASARSQANTARLLAENPTLARLRELEMLQGILQGSRATFVFGQGDLAEQVRSLVTARGSDAESTSKAE